MAVQGMAWLAGLAGLPTEGVQNSASDIVEGLEEKKSDQARSLSQYVQSQEGFKDTFKTAVSNPAFIADIVAQSAVLMLPGAALAATASKAGKIGLATQAGQRFIAEAGAKAAIQAGVRSSAPVTAAAIRTAQLSARQKVLTTLATGGAIVGEGLTAGGILGADVDEFVKGTDFENLAVNSERFRELVGNGMGMDEARTLLAKELAEPAALRAGTWTSLVSGVTGAGKFLGEVATGAGVTSLKQAVKNTAKETLDETLQEPGDAFFEHQAKVQIDPTLDLDLGQAAALGAVAGFGQSAGLNVIGAATAKASGINDAQVAAGIERIGAATNVDEVIAAASETIEQDPVTVEEVLNDVGLTVSDPSLADIAAVQGETVAEPETVTSEVAEPEGLAEAPQTNENVSLSTIFTDEGKERFPEGIPDGEEITNTPQEDESRAKFSKGTKPSGLYSKLEQVVGNAPPKVFGKASQVKLWLQSNAAKNGVKKDEMYWTGINEWLDTRGRVSKEDVSKFLEGNGVQVEEVSLSDEPVVLKRPSSNTRDTPILLGISESFPEVYDSGALRAELKGALEDERMLGFDTAAEAVDALRADPNWAETWGVSTESRLGQAFTNWFGYLDAVAEGSSRHAGIDYQKAKHNTKGLTLPGGKDYKEVVLTSPSVEKFKEDDETHFGDVGRGKQIAWMRNNVRETENGDTLFLEEIQSQRAQEGRKKGFKDKSLGDAKKKHEELQQEWNRLTTILRDPGTSSQEKERLSIERAAISETMQTMRVPNVPPAPFVSDSSNKATNAYISLVLKKAILQAVADGQNSVTWTTGDQQAERYDLSKSISEIRYSGDIIKAYDHDKKLVINETGVTDSNLENYVGKEVAERLINKPKEGQGQLRTLSGIDIKVGGNWTQSMYGGKTGLDTKGSPSLITQAANTILKQTGGGKVESISVGKLGSQPGFTISDRMRATVTGEGLPLFSKGVKEKTPEESTAEKAAPKKKGITESAAISRVENVIGAKAAKALLDSGELTFAATASDIKDIPGITGTEFAVTRGDGRMVLILDKLTAKNFDGVFKHEGFHSTIKELLGQKTYDNLIQSLVKNVYAAKDSQWIAQAYKNVPKNTHPDDIWEEVAAYAIEGYTNGEKQPSFIKRWVESFLSAIRTALIKSKGTPEAVKLWVMKNLKPQDLANLAVAGLRAKAVSTGKPTAGRPRFSEAIVKLKEVSVTEGKDVFKTGKQVTFAFLHNKESATEILGKPKKGAEFGREFEPSGRYMVRVSTPKTPDFGSFDTGNITFTNPLVIDNDNLGWKESLSKQYTGKKGKHLSKAIIADGYDAVVTVDVREGGRSSTSEIVDLTTFDESRARYSKETSPATIEVDGVERPTTNSDGKPIHPTEKGIRNFWEWFGDSKVVDEQGRPKVVYHGTGKDFEEFRPRTGGAVWFALDKNYARKYFSALPGANNKVIPAYLRSNTPLTVDMEGNSSLPIGSKKLKGVLNYARRIEDVVGVANQQGHDSVLFENREKTVEGYSSEEYAVFEPNQIKSAVGNTGDFSGGDNRIRFSKESDEKLPPIEVPVPEETKTQKAQRAVQGKFNRFKVIRDWLEKQGINTSEQADVYAAEERFHSKFANQVEDFREEVRNPLIEKITDAGFSMSDIADYLEAQHAAEANAQVQKVRGDPEATAYGITDDEAKAYLDKAKPELKKLANEVRDITTTTKNLLLDNGIINKDIAKAWDDTYKFYVPVKGGPDGKAASTPGKGGGMKAKRSLKRRLGHGKRDEMVVENIFADFERAVMTVELNRVGKHLVMMAAEIARDDLVTIGKPEKRGVIKTDKVFGVYNGEELLGTFEKEALAKDFAKTREAAHGKIAPLKLTVAPIFDSRVAYSASPMLADNELNVYIEGHAIRVQIVDDLLARAYGNLGAEALGYVLSAGRAINAYLSKVYTGYSPEFIVTNIVRDFTTGIINITGEEGIQMAANAVGKYPKAFASLLTYARTRKATPSIKAYRANGGNTGAAYLSDLERLGQEVETEVDSYRGVMANLKDKNVSGAARAAGRKAFNVTIKWIESLNQAGENAMRLAVFEAALDKGHSANKAASLAKNSTVNFNRKGEVGAEINAAYLFFNAAVQGVAATAHAMLKGKHKYQAWGLTGGMASLGYLLAAGMGGGDEDEYDKLSDYTKERNMVIKAGDGWVKVPMPYGYGFFWNFGRIMADAQRKDEWGKTPWRMSATAVEELTPFGSLVAGDDADSKQLLYALPTVAQMVGAPIANLSGMGGPIMPDNPFDRTQPDREKMWRGTQGTPFDVAAGWLEALGLDVSPETLRHYTRSLGGGAGDIVATGVGAANLTKEGAKLEAHEVPFVRKGFTKLRIGDTRRAYYDALKEASAAQDELNRARRDRDLGKMQDIRKEKRELLAMNRYAQKLGKVLSHKRDVQDALKADKTISVKERRLRLKVMESEEAKIYDRFLARFNEKTRSK